MKKQSSASQSNNQPEIYARHHKFAQDILISEEQRIFGEKFKFYE
ncbi:MAG: hypothetical protein WD077_12420 [Bacteroidia bacterium]